MPAIKSTFFSPSNAHYFNWNIILTYFFSCVSHSSSCYFLPLTSRTRKPALYLAKPVKNLPMFISAPTNIQGAYLKTICSVKQYSGLLWTWPLRCTYNGSIAPSTYDIVPVGGKRKTFFRRKIVDCRPHNRMHLHRVSSRGYEKLGLDCDLR